MLPHRLPLLLVVALGLPWGCQASAQNNVAAPSQTPNFKQRLALVQVNEGGRFGARSLKGLEHGLKRKLTADEQRAFTRTDEGKWKTYEDDWVRFEYPDEPELTVEVVDSATRDPIKVIGGVATMADNTFERAYWLKVGSLHYGVILLKEADWLDEGICLCGPIAFKKCVLEEGTMLEFSLLPNGKIKKVQALGEKHRAMLFEWTHSVITESAYARLGSSLRLKHTGTKSLEEWHTYSKSKRGWDGLLPWLESGDSAEKVTALLGEPTRKEDGHWHYISDDYYEDGSGDKRTSIIKLESGKFTGVDGDWQQWEKLPPKAGTLAWANSRLEFQEDDDVSKKEKDAAKLTDMGLIVELVLKHGPSANAGEWAVWTKVASDMANLGWKDERLGVLAASRYKEQELPQFYALNLLDAYEVKGRDEMKVQRLNHLLASNVEDSGELNNLLSSIPATTPGYVDALQASLDHAFAHVRRTAYQFAPKLPRAQALAALKKGLEDSESDAGIMAALNIDEVVTQEDLPWLQEKLKAAKDEEMQDALKQAIEAAKSKTKGKGKAKRK